MSSRKRVIAAALALISLPPLVALVEAVSFHVRNRNNDSIVSSGERREYLLHVPKSYDSTGLTPLVISMHGGGGWPAMQKDISEWNRLAERHGFIVVYPSGLKASGLRAWRVIRRGTGLTKDVQFISDLIDDLEKAYKIDPNRIYANGLSNGGGMAFVLSCTLSDRIAAVGMVAAAQMLPRSSKCHNGRPWHSIRSGNDRRKWMAEHQPRSVSFRNGYNHVMDRRNIEKRLSEELTGADDRIVAAYLFGSVARGTDSSDSDVDVGILLQTAPHGELNDLRFNLEGDLERALGRQTQIVVLNDAPPDLTHRVLRDGHLVLERDRAARIRFEVQARNEYFDLLPVLKRYRKREAFVP